MRSVDEEEMKMVSLLLRGGALVHVAWSLHVVH
jgi:hypothetical protein